MAYKNEESSFLGIIPRGIGFSDLPEDYENIEVPKDFQEKFEDERKGLLSLCGYAATRYNEVKKTLYLKAAFVSASLQNSASEVLDILLADQGILFTGASPHYRHAQVNNEPIEAQLPLFNSSTKRMMLYDDLCGWKAQNMSEQEIEIHKALLERIYKQATHNFHMGLFDWICEQKFEDTDETYRINYLRDMMPEYADKIDQPFTYVFFHSVLPEYTALIRRFNNRMYRPDQLSPRADREAVYLFDCYKGRLSRLRDLKEHFYQGLESSFQFQGLVKYFSFDRSLQSSSLNDPIVKAVRIFFEDIGRPLNRNQMSYAVSHVYWMLHKLTSWSKAERTLYPIYLLYMVICAGHKIATGAEIPVPEKKEEKPRYDSRMSVPKQRYAQLKLLGNLCNIFNIDSGDRIRNLRQFLFWQGKEIRSAKEVQFWRGEICKNYEILPAIGFQLCCLDYLQDCLPLDLEHLSYNTVSHFRTGTSLHLGGYHQFWKANQEVIRKQAKLLNTAHSGIVKEYKKLWGSGPKKYYYEGKAWLDRQVQEIQIDLGQFQDVSKYDPIELKRLILETELRICVNENARILLMRLCKNIYGFANGLFEVPV